MDHERLYRSRWRFLGIGPVLAQQTTGARGSHDATTTIDGHYLPSPPTPFMGENTDSLPQNVGFDDHVGFLGVSLAKPGPHFQWKKARSNDRA
jgi:hypothetical protein